jgi:DNA-binding transcriptional LysR family regulator
MTATPLVNTDRLQCFIEAAQLRSFSRAAERLHISQPAVSRHIRELEEALGTPLFHRAGRAVALTEAGHSFLVMARRVTDAAAALEMESQELAEDVAGLLKLGGSTVWEYILPVPMGQFRSEFPRAQLQLTVANTGQIIDLMLERQIHLGFVGEAPKEKDLTVTPVAVDELIIVAPAGHALARGVPVQPKELGSHPFLQREADSATARFARRYLAEMGVNPRTALELGSHEALKAGVRAGLGLGMLSRFSVTHELASGALAEVRLDAPPCQRPLYVLQDPARPASRPEKEFLTRLSKYLRSGMRVSPRSPG